MQRASCGTDVFRGSRDLLSTASGLMLLLLVSSHASAQHESSAKIMGVDRGRITFQENRGQWPESIRFVARSRDVLARVEDSGLAFELRSPGRAGASGGVLVRMEVEGRQSAWPEGEQELRGKHHYCFGSDSSWIRNVRTFGQVRLPCVADGIDWVLREHRGILEYDLELAAGADLAALTIRCQGQDGISIEEDGSLWIHTRAGVLHQQPPTSWEESETGERSAVDVYFHKLGEERFGFVAPRRDRTKSLHIDPGIEWATYLGGLNSTAEYVELIERDDSGNIVVAGETAAADFPVTPGAFTTPSLGGESIFITKFDPTGGLIYSSHIAPVVLYCELNALALDSLGRATVCGDITHSPTYQSFPTTPGGFDTVVNSFSSSGYVLRLSTQGDALEFSTLLESPPGGCIPYGLDVAASGATVVAGLATGQSYPTTPCAYDTTFDNSLGAGSEGFVTRIAPDGSHLEWSTFLGGSGGDFLYLIALDTLENVTVAGLTGSSDFPFTPGALSVNQTLTAKLFVTRLNPQGSALIWSANAGGPYGAGQDDLSGMAIGRDGSVFVASSTKSYFYITTPGAFLAAPTNLVNDYIGYVFRIDPTGSSLLYATYLTNYAYARGIAVDASGVATIAVADGRSTMPVTPGAPTGSGVVDGADALILRLDPLGSKAYYSGRFGGAGGDGAECVVSLDEHHVALGGSAQPGFPMTTGAFDTTFNGGLSDGLVAVVDLMLQGVQVLGTSSPACSGSIVMNTTQMPAAGAQGFGFWCSGAPPNSNGWLILGAHATQPTFRQGAALWFDPLLPIRIRAVSTDALGFVETPVALTGLPTGVSFAAQFVFRNPAGCAGTGAFSASNALRILTQ